MNFDLPGEVVEIMTIVQKAGFEIYVVGGSVRDMLMKRETYDWDFTTNATPDEIQELFPDSFYDNSFGTVGVPSKTEGERPHEITTFRTEHGYSDSRRPDEVRWGSTLEEDLERRDFTINAMALAFGSTKKQEVQRNKKQKPLQTSKSRASDTQIIDPFGGQNDLEKKLIRAVGNAERRFDEDALRMMRAVRLASELNFKIEEKTQAAIKKNAKSIHKIAAERVRDELLKLVASPHAYNGMVEFRNVGLLQEILPELEKGFDVQQKSPGRHHIYDVGTHSLMSLKYCRSTDPVVRLATLIHDIGKPQTYKKLDTGVITFYNHEVVGGKIAKRVADRLKFSNNQKDKLYKLVRYHQFTVDERQTDSAIRRFIRKVGPGLIADILNLRIADRLGGGARETSWRLEEFKQRLVEVQKQPFTVHDLKISGHDVMDKLGIKPGPQVGEILKKLYNEVVTGKISNTKKDLLSKLKDYGGNGA